MVIIASLPEPEKARMPIPSRSAKASNWVPRFPDWATSPMEPALGHTGVPVQ